MARQLDKHEKGFTLGIINIKLLKTFQEKVDVSSRELLRLLNTFSESIFRLFCESKFDADYGETLILLIESIKLLASTDRHGQSLP
jgi:hypothetical protein